MDKCFFMSMSDDNLKEFVRYTRDQYLKRVAKAEIAKRFKLKKEMSK